MCNEINDPVTINTWCRGALLEVVYFVTMITDLFSLLIMDFIKGFIVPVTFGDNTSG